MVVYLAGCGGGGASPSDQTWNFLVYMDADNNLEKWCLPDLNEMEMVGSTDKVNVFVLCDRAAGSDESEGYTAADGDWTGGRIYHITKDNKTEAVTSPYYDWSFVTGGSSDEPNMGAAITLIEFLNYCAANFDADRTILTFWNHGAGVHPRSIAGGDPSGRGICFDDSADDDCLTTDEIALALTHAENATGKRIEVINLSVCLTQMLEVAYELRDVADYLVGSQAVSWSCNNSYNSVLNTLNGNNGMTPRQFAVALVNDYYNTMRAKDLPMTFSVLDLGAPLNNLVNAADALAFALRTTLDLDALCDAFIHTTTYSNASEYHEIHDLYDFAKELRTSFGPTGDPAVLEAADAVMAAINAAVIHHRENGKYADNLDLESHGVSILIPQSHQWIYYSDPNQYEMLQMSIDTEWNEFIKEFVNRYNGIAKDTMTITLGWDSDNCDVGVKEPDGEFYFSSTAPVPGGGISPNGHFSSDQTDGGTEIWTLEATHDSGAYVPAFLNWDYTGTLDLTVVVNGITIYDQSDIRVESGNFYWLAPGWYPYIRGRATYRLQSAPIPAAMKK